MPILKDEPLLNLSSMLPDIVRPAYHPFGTSRPKHSFLMEENQRAPLPPPVSLDVFGNGKVDFWMGDLEGILEKYPFLEYPHKQSFYMLLYVEQAAGEVTID